MPYDDGFFRSLLDTLSEGVTFVNHDRQICYWNRGAAEITGYRDFHVLGQRCSDGLLEHVDEEGRPLCGDRCPLASTLADGVSREIRGYLHHREGHCVPVLVRTSAIRASRGTVTGAVEVFSDTTPQLRSEERIRELKLLSLLDPVTGVGSRRWAEMTIRNRVVERDRYGLSSGVLLIDVDGFAGIRERHGPETADRLLRVMARSLEGALRAEDFLGRWGDDEFLVVLASVNPGQLASTAQRVRLLAARSTVAGVPAMSHTVSIGAALARTGETANSLTRRIEERVGTAREGGGDRVEIGDGEPGTRSDERAGKTPVPAVSAAAFARDTLSVHPRTKEELERLRRIRTAPVHVPPEIRAAMRARSRPGQT